jgi:cellulose biosynthesis protein BcsQ
MKDYLGVYTVGDKTYTDKIEAILEANITKADITWDFHQTRFKQANWKIEPELSLRELYKIRAQQIRDEYDYVVIMFSGGADSTNVLYSFVSNNIKVDEIVSGIPESGLKNFNATRNVDSTNNASEWLLTTMPYLREVSQKHPDIKISVNDFFKTMLDFKTDEWIYKSSDHIHPTTSARYDLSRLAHIRQLADQGKKIAVIYGSEKPSIQFYQDKVISTIGDGGVNVPRQPFDIFYPNVDIVLFYTTPAMPQILIKASHQVAKAIFTIPQYHYIKHMTFDYSWPDEKKSQYDWGVWQRTIIPVIYPDINYSAFQSLKSKNIFMAQHDNWFHSLHKDTRLNQLVTSDFNNFYKSIDPKYLLPKWKDGLGFKKYLNFYVIGTIEQFQNSL